MAAPGEAQVAVESLPEVVPALSSDGDHPGPNGALVADASGVVIDDIPGLTSADGNKGTSGTRSVRERLRGLKNRKAERGAQVVQVGPRAARPVGPAVKDGTEARQRAGERKTVVVGPKRQRYANRPAPPILSGRPQWVQELFESHFRSEQALALRRDNGRMKISRLDYAIGWLVAFDKFREEPALLRAKKDGAA